jgi:hypothetical protein
VTGRTDVIVALTPIAEDAIEDALFAASSPLKICASLAEADELEAHALDSGAVAVLLSPDLPGLSAGHCARLRALGLRLIGVALDQSAERELNRLGVDAIVAPGASHQVLSAALDDHQAAGADIGSGAGLERSPREAAGWRSPERVGRWEAPEAGRGSVLAVVGGKGAPGASECAASLATVAGDRWATVLVELDALGGGLDLRLGADPHTGSLLAAVRAAGATRPAGELLERWLVRHPGWPPVLLGPPEPERALPELSRPGAITTTLAGLARAFSLTVCDVGWLLNPAGEPTVARVHREALVAADSVLLVIGCRDDQVRSGLAQLDRLLGELEILPERLRIAANGAGGPAAGGSAATLQTLTAQLAERGLALDATLPWDERALARAGRRGLPLARAGRRNGYRRALTGLLGELFLAASPAPRRRKLKLQLPTSGSPAGEEVTLPWRS